MQKVILYGIKNRKLRQKVASYLADGYEIIGFTDSFIKDDYLQGLKYFGINEIKQTEFDYILVMSEKADNRLKIVSTLCKEGIDKHKIITPYLFLHDGFEFIPNLKKEINIDLGGGWEGCSGMRS